ncbi:MAG: type I-E CRISPR-associated protein Cas5/CasD [Anaerolineaceae bacterium]|nr:type I-E CRISPR-associated protein Cas5/CasD [Anaerolineaceae bacterium]
MNTLLIQIVAPMQSWGVQSLHDQRDSGLEPTKSGMIGLIASAMGLDRTDDVAELAVLKMGVRVDREGRLDYDFQKAEPLDRFGEKSSGSKVTIGQRAYLADAAFLVGLEGNLIVLQCIEAALHRPKRSLYFGRKAFPPSAPLWVQDGLQIGENLLDALRKFPPITAHPPSRRRFILEDPRGEIILNDQPLSFAARRFAPRCVHIDYLTVIEEAPCISPN